jgi:hypothetical protein
MTAPQPRAGPPDEVVAPTEAGATKESRFHTSSTNSEYTGERGLAEMMQGPRPWSHKRDGCETCTRFALLTARRRRMEIDAFNARCRITDLREMAS